MLFKRDFFNKNSVNIFTDASLKTINGRTSVCPGCSVYVGDTLVYQTYTILHDATINQGELSAIMLGIETAVKYRHIGEIRLFSDSQTSIFAIRDRIFNWVYYSHNRILRGSDGKEIANVTYIMDIIYYILQSQLFIEFYHVKGHIKFHDYYDIQKAKTVFIRSNNISDKIDDELIRQLSIGNDQVDKYTGIMLDLYINDKRFTQTGIPALIFGGYSPFDTIQYKRLIGGNEI